MQSKSGGFFKGLYNKAHNTFNPVIGHHLFKWQNVDYLLRIDSRKPEEINQQKGLPGILTPELLKLVRRTQFEEYQSSDKAAFALGACTSYQELHDGYILGNKDIADSRFLYGFYGPAVSLNLIRLEVLSESSDRDYENEHLILADIPLEKFLFATSPKDRKAFEQGAVVSNHMAQYIPRVPTTLKIGDISNLPSTLRWLLNNNSYEKAADLSKAVFTGKDSKTVEVSLKGDKELAKEVDSLLNTTKTFNPGS